jgi:excisionase family DNA binding protein
MRTNRANRVDDVVSAVVGDLPTLLTREEVADLLRCQKNFVSQLIESGELVGFQRRAAAGSRLLIPRDAVRRYLERAAR